MANSEHRLQQMLNNIPTHVTVNSQTSSVVSSGGSLFQAGLVENSPTCHFNNVSINPALVGKIVDSKATENALYVLSANGSVFEYRYNQSNPNCVPNVSEVYSPEVCHGDKAVSISTGYSHCVLLTENNKAYGVGNNENYQIVPQGQCNYNVAVEILVTDVNVHDNSCACKFQGNLNILEKPVIPSKNNCSNTCVQDTVRDVVVGSLSVPGVIVNIPGTGSVTGTLSIPVYGSYSYVGVLCVGSDGKTLNGTVNFQLTALYIKGGCVTTTLKPAVSAAIPVTVVFNADIPLINLPVSQSILVSQQCGTPLNATFTVTGLNATAANDRLIINSNVPLGNAIILNSTTLTLQTSPVQIPDAVQVFPLTLSCPTSCVCEETKCGPCLPQPCWKSVYAGSNITVLVDECKRLYILGSLWEIRNNKKLLQRNCLEDIINRNATELLIPADQINCGRNVNNGCCAGGPQQCTQLDLSRFGVKLSLGGQDGCGCAGSSNVCDILSALQKCNNRPYCNNTCEPCDPYIYLNVTDPCCGTTVVNKILLVNSKSAAKTVSLVDNNWNSPLSNNTVEVNVTTSSIIEWDYNHYCIDDTDVSLDNNVSLVLNDDPSGVTVTLFVDVAQQGGIRFNSCDDGNIEFVLGADEPGVHYYVLNYGGPLDPVDITNVKLSLDLYPGFQNPRFKNPLTAKLTNTYLRGGDVVCFKHLGSGQLKLTVTPDVPTVFKLGRKVLDVAIGYNNLSVLVGGLNCPNEIYAIGNNCFGQLGLGSFETPLCWQKVNRCLFNWNCEVRAIFAGPTVTFYVTDSSMVFASGQWKNLVNCNEPTYLPCICQSWMVSEIAVSDTHILVLGNGCLFGTGDNTLGELGVDHMNCVPKFVPIAFMPKHSNYFDRREQHPMERRALQYGKGVGGACCASCANGGQCESKRCEPEVRYFKSNGSNLQKRVHAYIPNSRASINRGK
jgi:hypothetical protein